MNRRVHLGCGTFVFDFLVHAPYSPTRSFSSLCYHRLVDSASPPVVHIAFFPRLCVKGMEYENQGSMASKYDCLLFDLDDTLYPYSSGLSVRITKNIQEYMIQKLGIDESIVADMCFVLYKHYGTTLAGLRAIGYDFDYDDFHGFVHGRLPYELLKSDSVLRNLLHSLPMRKVVFTNGDEAHLSRALERLGLVDCFDRIICFETLNPTKGNNASHDSHENASEIFDIMKYCADPDGSGRTLPKTPVVCKPFEDAYEEAFKLAEIDPKRTLFFDDSVRNVVVASSLRLHCVLVGKSERPEGVEFALESIHNMKEAIPELRGGDEKPESIIHPQEIAIETSVVA